MEFAIGWRNGSTIYYVGGNGQLWVSKLPSCGLYNLVLVQFWTSACDAHSLARMNSPLQLAYCWWNFQRKELRTAPREGHLPTPGEICPCIFGVGGERREARALSVKQYAKLRWLMIKHLGESLKYFGISARFSKIYLWLMDMRGVF